MDNERESNDEDVFISDGIDHTALQNLDPSEIPRLRETHTTAGYREGLAASKDQSLQPGFDEGYPLGAEFGLKVGWILGVLQGICNALHTEEAQVTPEDCLGVSDSNKTNGIPMLRIEKDEVRKLLIRAQDELKVEKLFARPYWREDGIWKYEMGTEEEETTFKQVAQAHPVVKEWTERAKSEMQRWGLREHVFNGQDWEAGRVGEE